MHSIKFILHPLAPPSHPPTDPDKAHSPKGNPTPIPNDQRERGPFWYLESETC